MLPDGKECCMNIDDMDFEKLTSAVHSLLRSRITRGGCSSDGSRWEKGEYSADKVDYLLNTLEQLCPGILEEAKKPTQQEMLSLDQHIERIQRSGEDKHRLDHLLKLRENWLLKISESKHP